MYLHLSALNSDFSILIRLFEGSFTSEDRYIIILAPTMFFIVTLLTIMIYSIPEIYRHLVNRGYSHE
jgi:ABC-type multidrug transport system permease subunit